MSLAARSGVALPNAANIIGDLEEVCEAAVVCEERLADAFGERLADFDAENAVRCDQQETSARKFAERRLGELGKRLAKYRNEGNIRPIAMTEGLVRKEETQLSGKLDRIARRRFTDPTMIQLAVGVVRVVP